MKQTRFLVITFTISLLLFTGASFASPDDLEHPVIKPMPGFKIIPRISKKDPFGTLSIWVKENKRTARKNVEGLFWRLNYTKDQKTPVSAGVILGNYRSAVAGKGGEVTFSGKNDLHFSVPRKDGGTSYATLHVAYSHYELKIVDEKSLKTVLTFGAEELKKALDTDGHIAVYGINFKVNSDSLQAGAAKILEEFARLLILHPDLKVEIQGHTDNTGTAAHNLELSNRRAQTVQKFVELYGIDTSRMKAKGYGQTKPVDTNDTEEGRAKNRRVELVKIK